MNFIAVGEARAGELAEAVERARGHAGDFCDGEPEFGLGVEFVDVLPAGAAASGELDEEGLLGGGDARGEIDAGGHGVLCWVKEGGRYGWRSQAARRAW